MSQSFVLFCGSRSFGSAFRSVIRLSVLSVLDRGRGVSVGCAVGADAFALDAALSFLGSRDLPSRLKVFCAFGPGGAGAWSGSSVALVERAATLGASVSWWSGGGASVPLVARLRQRSRSAVLASSLVLAFLWGDLPCRGTFGTVRFAESLGLPFECSRWP